MSGINVDKLWRDESILTDLRDAGYSYSQIAEELGCSKATVAYWCEKYGLNGHLKSGTDGIYIFTNVDNGYVQLHHRDKDSHDFCYLHQLVAIAGGADPYDVFGGGKQVHHETHIPWDNRVEAVTLMDPGEHARLHRQQSAERASV